MSGAQAAVVAAGCCCQHQGGGGPPPVACSDSSPGAVSDRATTAINAYLQLYGQEISVVNRIEAGRTSAFQTSRERNCTTQVGNQCVTGTDSVSYIPFRCEDPPPNYNTQFFGGDPFVLHAGTCYNQTGQSNHVHPIGSPCYCKNEGGCPGCAPHRINWADGNCTLLQTSAGARSWRTYQTAATEFPDNRFGEWDWFPGIESMYYRIAFSEGVPYTQSIRLFCPAPLGITTFRWGAIRTSNGAAFTQLVQVDPAGQYVNPSRFVPWTYTSGRWGSANVGRLYGVADVQIEYRTNYASLGAGWLAEVALYYIFREQHRDIRAAFQRAAPSGQVARWHVQSLVPPDMPFHAGFNDGVSPASPSSFYRWQLWKPCVSGNDTVRGTYQPIGPDPGPSFAPNPRDRIYDVNGTCYLSSAAYGDATLDRMIIT